MNVDFSIGGVFESLQVKKHEPDLPAEKVIVGKDHKGSEAEQESSSTAIKVLTETFDQAMKMAMLTNVISTIGQTTSNLQRQP